MSPDKINRTKSNSSRSILLDWQNILVSSIKFDYRTLDCLRRSRNRVCRLFLAIPKLTLIKKPTAYQVHTVCRDSILFLVQLEFIVPGPYPSKGLRLPLPCLMKRVTFLSWILARRSMILSEIKLDLSETAPVIYSMSRKTTIPICGCYYVE